MKRLSLIAFLAMALMAKAQTITIGEGNGMSDAVPYNTFSITRSPSRSFLQAKSNMPETSRPSVFASLTVTAPNTPATSLFI